MTVRGRTATLLVAGVLACADAWGGDASSLRAAALAAGCAACHGSGGRAAPGSPLPSLAAMPANRIRDAMQAFKRGGRDGTVMPQIAKGYSDDEVDRLAAWFARQTDGPRP